MSRGSLIRWFPSHFIIFILKQVQFHRTCSITSISSSSPHILQLSGWVRSHLSNGTVTCYHSYAKSKILRLSLEHPIGFCNAQFKPKYPWNPAVFHICTRPAYFIYWLIGFLIDCSHLANLTMISLPSTLLCTDTSQCITSHFSLVSLQACLQLSTSFELVLWLSMALSSATLL